MTAAMRFDPSYSCELFSWPDMGACVARVGRPADHIARGHATTADARLVLVTAGEVRCPGGADRAPDVESIACRGTGSREAARLYDRLGEDALARLDGAFAGFLVDRRRATSI